MSSLPSLLIAINIIAFLLIFSLPHPSDAVDLLSFSRAHAFDWWRWITALFVHASASHLFFNMIGMYFFGKVLDLPKSWFLSIVFVGGMLGNLAFALTSTAPVVGASGAVFSLMGAAMLLHPLKKVSMYIIPLPLAWVAVPFAVIETFIVAFQPSFADPQVASIAHVAGLLAGTIFAFFHSPTQSVKGMFLLGGMTILLLILSPLFLLVAGIGGAILNVFDVVIGFVLYGLAFLVGRLWV